MRRERTSPDVARELSKRWPDPDIKLWITSSCLAARREAADLFAFGEYIPLTVEGKLADHVIAFARRLEGNIAIVCRAAAFLSLARSQCDKDN